MPGDEDNKTVNISLQDIKALERLAVVEASHKILVGDFQNSRDHVNESLNKIFDIVNSIPGKITECKDTLEHDIDNTYMTKTAGVLLEQKLSSNTRSIKLWIVSSVSGATAAGVAIMWFFKLTGH